MRRASPRLGIKRLRYDDVKGEEEDPKSLGRYEMYPLRHSFRETSQSDDSLSRAEDVEKETALG